MSEANLNALREKLGEIADVKSAVNLLDWDQQVYMPPKGAPGRGQQLATLSALAHRLFTAPEVGALLNDLHDAPGLEPDDAKLVEETLIDYDRATKLPETFVHEFAQAQSQALATWTEARKNADFAAFQPYLARIVDLVRRKADYFGYVDSPYDPLVEEFERGMTTRQLRAIFGELAPRQRDLIERIGRVARPTPAWLDQDWDEEKQWAFTMWIVKEMGYDLDAGRQDKSAHPFTTTFDLHDVRITTRLNRKELFSGLMGSMHEAGHALYEQGFLEKDRRTVLAEAPSLGIHESQSLMWENIVGGSLPFWKRYAAVLREFFPGQLDGVGPEVIHEAVNHVSPSFIRVEADECTYNLHIILRFEIEVDLVEGRIGVADIPELWNAKMKTYLGLDVPNDALGCLQDMHWCHGAMGYFPTYALGNLYAAQLFEKVEQEVPDLWLSVEAGDFAPLRDWLREHVHRIGRRQTAPQIVEAATGLPPTPEPFLRYLNHKYSRLYGM